MKIYFASAVMDNHGSADSAAFVELLKKYGEVTDEGAGWNGEDVDSGLTPKEIHDRDFAWLLSSDVVVAEVTTKSLGVGYEIGRAVEMGKKVLCLYRQPEDGRKLSFMIDGCDGVEVKRYKDVEDARAIIDTFMKGIG